MSSKAQYLEKFGVPMSNHERAEVAARERYLRRLWYGRIRPNLVRRPSIWRRLALLHLPVQQVAVPPDADLPPAPLTSLSGFPIHLFKMDGSDRWYYYGPLPSPGFPGS